MDELTTTTETAPTTTRILRGPEELRDTVREALRRWRFRPATVNGHAIAVYRTMPFRFVLDNL